MKILLLAILMLIAAAAAEANTLTWEDRSNNEDGFSIEMLVKGSFQEVARVAANVTTYTDSLTEGVYRLRAFIKLPTGEVFSPYSETAAKLNAPVNATVK